MQTKTSKSVNKLSAINENPSEINHSEIGRQERIAVLAYEKAEKRGFVGTEADTVQDWLEAEKEIDGYDVPAAKQADF
ncbi:DUF2934 domain-containing protein [Nitrosomonas sp. JL21]|uniref:DUF2934 domain-containing protein n=1 Tax=Nitrosomonas sp. JL21 TaxID=153949 RepID=UPI00136AD8A9|nr:DUF2934 domain-containing protein [Nitrosomonas sp. JL21]MBL8498023.1 DUF2934 domain-containing protein [Nitrosomonas sp.]MXS78736.1 DUF2934 domain-containing protein [Nitrosomonas sp. JL21]